MLPFTIRIDIDGERDIFSDITLSSGDINAYGLILEFFKGGAAYDVTGCALAAYARQEGGSAPIPDVGTITNGKGYYVIKPSMYSHSGALSLEIVLTDTNGMHIVAKVLHFTVRSGFSADGGSVVNETDYSVLTKLISEAQAATMNAANVIEYVSAHMGQIEDATATKEEFDAHKGNTANPHGVTKAQVGLESVDNAKQATKAEFDVHTEAFDTHRDDTANPHEVTKEQVGLGEVDNARQATKEEFDAHTAGTAAKHKGEDVMYTPTKSVTEKINEIIVDGGGGTMYHEELLNRNEANQHSMDAVTGLSAAMAGVQASANAAGAEAASAHSLADSAYNKAKRYATIVVGCAASGHTADTVDYLCSGADDNLIVQAALDALPDTGGKVLLLEGVYSFSQGVELPAKPNVTIEGMGSSSVIQGGVGISYFFTSSKSGAFPAEPVRGLCMRDMRLIMVPERKESEIPIEYCLRLFVTESTLSGIEIGTHEAPIYASEGISLLRGNENTVENCRLYGMHIPDLTYTAGIHVDSSILYVNKWREISNIRNNRICGFSVGIWAGQAFWCNISENRIFGISFCGIWLISARYTNITANVLFGLTQSPASRVPALAGITINGGGNMVVSANNIAEIEGVGIEIASGDTFQITGNNVESDGNTIKLTTGTLDCNVVGNVLKGTPHFNGGTNNTFENNKELV